MIDWTKRRRLVLALILVAAASLRVAGIRQDLPNFYFTDEAENVYNALKYGTGNLNPHDYINPPLFQYAIFGLFGCFYALGRAVGWFAGREEFIRLYLTDASAFFLIARGLVAALGTATVYFVYRLGATLAGAPLGLLAAAILAVFPVHVVMSHHGTVDIPMTAVFAAGLWFLARWGKSRRTQDWVIACAAGGVAAGTKYTGGILLLGILLTAAVIETTPIRALRRMVLSGLIFGAAFVAVDPFALLDNRNFLEGIHKQWLVNNVGWKGWETPISGYHAQLSNLIHEGGIVLLLLGATGIAVAAVRGPAMLRVLVVVPVVFFLIIGNSQLTYSRFTLPLTPFLSLFSAYLLLGARRPEEGPAARGAPWRALLAVALIGESLSYSVGLVRKLTLPDTRSLARQWFETHIPPGSRVLREERTPPIRLDSASLDELVSEKLSSRNPYAYREASDWFFSIQRQLSLGGITYHVTDFHHPVAYKEVEHGYNREWVTVEKERAILSDLADKYDVIVVDEANARHYFGEAPPEKYRFLRAFYESVEKDGKLLAEFHAEPGKVKGSTLRIFAPPPRAAAAVVVPPPEGVPAPR